MASKNDLITGFERNERPAKFWTLMGPNFASEEIHKCLPTLHDEPDNDVWFLVVDKSQAVSFACLRVSKDGKSAQLAHHWASDGCRGKGYAKLLTEARIRYAKEHGIKKLRAVVHADSMDAFLSQGFSVKVSRAQFNTMEKALA